MRENGRGVLIEMPRMTVCSHARSPNTRRTLRTGPTAKPASTPATGLPFGAQTCAVQNDIRSWLESDDVRFGYQTGFSERPSRSRDAQDGLLLFGERCGSIRTNVERGLDKNEPDFVRVPVLYPCPVRRIRGVVEASHMLTPSCSMVPSASTIGSRLRREDE
jgi:hypothetical protein